jgi:methyl-accepting chemotaxis protein
VELTEAQHAEIRQAVADFKRGMDIRSSLNLRIAKRITWILRTGSVSMGVITVIMVFALMAFNNKLVEMNNVLDTMNQKFGSMSADMGKIQIVLKQMDRNVTYLPDIVDETSAMKDMMQVMRADIGAVSGSVANLQGTLTGITENVDHMTHTFRGLDHTMRYIDADLNKISGPSRMFNKTMPFLP